MVIYIAAQILVTFLTKTHPDTSPFGLIWLTATLTVMLLLAWGKAQTGKQLGNEVLQTEGRVTLVDAYLAAAVLVGLVLNALFSWWWADPLAGVVIIYYGAIEGWHAWHGGE